MPLDRHCPVEQRVFRRLEMFVDAFEERSALGHLLEVLKDENESLDGTKLGQGSERLILEVPLPVPPIALPHPTPKGL